MTQWNHDMSAAPRDPNVKLLVADADGSSPRESRWIPAKLTASGRLLEGDRWSGYSRGKQPAAWMPWPANPFAAATQGEAAAPAPMNVSLPADERSGEGANTGGGHVIGDGNAHPISAGALVSAAPVFFLDDVGSGA